MAMEPSHWRFPRMSHCSVDVSGMVAKRTTAAEGASTVDRTVREAFSKTVARAVYAFIHSDRWRTSAGVEGNLPEWFNQRVRRAVPAPARVD